ncbi:hypothetical protein JQX13_16200 [Archangium violaceum]|uniref:hypothetical protein n=1 Tax=Archangium violaceum TaxID=83451 RepID=UPI00193BCDDF|nr:hypothetical protein [Archangium violaceum]QRK11475.1 hypothetical protein JQX13_16200 [Archangium violaceum]
MRKTMKMSLAALASLAILPTAVTAHEVRSPHPGTVTALTYYSSGSFHGAIDVASGSGCNYWGVQTGVVGSVSWNVTIRTSTNVCYGNGSGNQNEVKHIWANGYTFRIWHFNKTANSYDRTCDRCQVGDEGGTGNVTGPHSHIQYDLNGSNDTSWYANYTTKGEYVDRSETLGYLD